MDSPLLAFTGRRDVTGSSAEIAAAENMRQLIQLRWLAVGGQLLTILAVDIGLGVPLPLAPMLGIVGLLALANLLGIVPLPRGRVTNVEITLALLFDIGALTAQLYLSGGATNPFASLFLLQVVLGAILLEGWSAWVVNAVTILCYAGLTVQSRPLAYPPGLIPDIADLYTLGAWISFALTATLLGLFITRITRNLRTRDQYVADLRRRAVEEDNIVRMGLFASGAAHELGTPLASLAVILNDWRRMPQLADDPELAGELEDMQAEVQRCKAIVTGILHSAGEPRGEAMASSAVCSFLDEIVTAWRSTYASVPLEYVCDDLGEATIVADASLRQAITNLLDNAAESSRSQVALRAWREDELLVVSVTDDGRGFTEAQLGFVGRPYPSGKGAGHGLGLFLTANVARRQGGRLEIANRPEGGADVRLVLPLASHENRGGR